MTGGFMQVEVPWHEWKPERNIWQCLTVLHHAESPLFQN